MTTPWLLSTPQAAPTLRLICFAYAGGNARMYLPWQKELGPGVEVCAVQLPGRGTRRGEQPLTSLTELVDILADILHPKDDIPFVFFGHSLGALIAFELARFFARYRMRMPAEVIVSGANAPALRNPPRGLHQMDDDDLIAQLKAFNGTPPAVMKYRELLMMALPAIRADFQISETYRYYPAPKLHVPLTVLAGRDDPLTTAPQIDGWAAETTGACKIHWLEGDHFFINDDVDAVLALVRDVIAARDPAAFVSE